jgi:signal-transduction protein with cAMP-binding, CBS, and nucleotidyltransferase domain
MRQMSDSDDGSAPPTPLSPKAILRHNYLFRGLSDAALEGLAALAAKRTYYQGGVIFSQGDEGDALFGVAAGRVRISASASGGREVFLNIMEPSDTFGEIAVMDGLPRTANAVALDTTTLIVIQRADFLPFLRASRCSRFTCSNCCASGCAGRASSSKSPPSWKGPRGSRNAC